MAPHSSTLAWNIPWAEEPGRLQSMGSLRVGHDLSDFTFTFHFHALEKEMETHSSVLAWRIPGTGEPGGLPSMGSHRVGHDWSDLEEEFKSRRNGWNSPVWVVWQIHWARNALSNPDILIFLPVTLNLCPYICMVAAASSSLGPRASQKTGKGGNLQWVSPAERKQKLCLNHQLELCHVLPAAARGPGKQVFFCFFDLKHSCWKDMGCS